MRYQRAKIRVLEEELARLVAENKDLVRGSRAPRAPRLTTHRLEWDRPVERNPRPLAHPRAKIAQCGADAINKPDALPR